MEQWLFFRLGLWYLLSRYDSKVQFPTPDKHCSTEVYLQVKTNEADTPWDPKPEVDQRVDGSAKLFKDGVDQLERDTLRFLELVPDIQMANLRIVTNVAFPEAPESTDRALTKNDFLIENAPLLLEKLGVPKEVLQSPQGPPTAEGEETFKRIICRYLGAHAQVPARISMEKGVEALELAVTGTEVGLRVESSDPPICDEEKVENMRKVVTKDSKMKEIRRAIEIPRFGKKFQSENLNIPLKDLKLDRERFLKQTSTNSYPLFGKTVLDAILRAADKECAHQGAEAILDLLAKERHLFFDDNGFPMDQKTTVDEHVQGCKDCSEVHGIKGKVPSSEGHLLQIPATLEHEVLIYADKLHRGFAEAYGRVKTWVDFPHLKRKVSEFEDMHHLMHPSHYFFSLQIQQHTAGCPECGKRTAQLLLSSQQREAISRRHHLKFILGHYGSGKVLLFKSGLSI